MATQAYLILALLVLAANSVTSQGESLCQCTEPLSRSSFPTGFVFGAGGSAYQFEGAAFDYGKGPSIWDNFTHTYPDRITDNSNGDIAIDSYNRYKEDTSIAKKMGLDAYRFSISWSRILPYGNLSGGVNKDGIEYYDNLIDDLIAKGIEPFVTLFHWDVPQALEDYYDGFLSRQIVDAFRDFADVCFWKFGDRVKHWVTLNEPWSFSFGGYASGKYAPGRCSSWQNCSVGDAGTEPYIVTHNQLLAHAAAVELYKKTYQPYQNGEIGITLVSEWYKPYNNTSEEDQAAAIRKVDFMFGWFMDPLTFGDYPDIMKTLVGSRLPSFTPEESQKLIGSMDFLGLNYYTANYAIDDLKTIYENKSYNTDPHVNCTGTGIDGTLIGPQAGSSWLYVVPDGIRELLLYIKAKYNVSAIYITENGFDQKDDGTLTLKEALNDTRRISYHNDHFCCIDEAMKLGDINVKGYFAWSLMDNFEWCEGYTVRFGMNYVDYENNLTRIPKRSVGWFTKFLRESFPISQPRISDQ